MCKKPSVRIDGGNKKTLEWQIHGTVCKFRKDSTVLDD